MSTEFETFRRNLDILVAYEDGKLERVAVHADIPYTTLANWRHRGTRPTLPSVEKLAKAYGLHRDDLLDRQLSTDDLA